LAILELNQIHSVVPVEMKKRLHVFGIVTQQRTFYMQASSELDMLKWIFCVRAMIKDGAAIASGDIHLDMSAMDALVEDHFKHMSPATESLSSPAKPIDITKTAAHPLSDTGPHSMAIHTASSPARSSSWPLQPTAAEFSPSTSAADSPDISRNVSVTIPSPLSQAHRVNEVNESPGSPLIDEGTSSSEEEEDAAHMDSPAEPEPLPETSSINSAEFKAQVARHAAQQKLDRLKIMDVSEDGVFLDDRIVFQGYLLKQGTTYKKAR
jgi:hypothetical protein